VNPKLDVSISHRLDRYAVLELRYNDQLFAISGLENERREHALFNLTSYNGAPLKILSEEDRRRAAQLLYSQGHRIP
jgi:hypothetical protein